MYAILYILPYILIEFLLSIKCFLAVSLAILSLSLPTKININLTVSIFSARTLST